MSDIVTIGSATMDVFVECEDASVVSVATKDKKSEFMSYRYGAKLEISDFDSKVGGGGVNTAVNFANLGFSTSAIFKIGDDIYSQGIIIQFPPLHTRFSLFDKIVPSPSKKRTISNELFPFIISILVLTEYFEESKYSFFFFFLIIYSLSNLISFSCLILSYFML